MRDNQEFTNSIKDYSIAAGMNSRTFNPNPHTYQQPHIVFLFSDTGGGHRSVAQAIIEAINIEFSASSPGKWWISLKITLPFLSTRLDRLIHQCPV